MADNNPDSILNLISSLESMFTSVTDGLNTAISGVTGSLGNLEARINGLGGGGLGPGGNTGPGGGGPPNAPAVDFTTLVTAINRLNQNITVANNQNAGAPPPIINGSTKPTYTAGQIAEMQRHQAQLGSGRVNSDIPTFATEGRVLPQSPLSTLQRSNDLLGINLGVSGRATPGQYPTNASSIDIGNDLKTFLGKNETAIRTLQGSLGKSYEYAQNMGQTSDDFRNTMFTRSKMQEFYQQQEAAGTPISKREQGLFNVGLNERAMRDSSMLTGAASNSLGRFIGAHQSGAINYTPFIAMDSTGANGTGAAGATVSTRRVMKSDDMGTYAQGILKTMERMDQIGTASDVKQSAVNDVQTKLNSVRDRIAASVLTPDMERKLQTVGVDTSSVNFDAVRRAQEVSTNASNKLKVLGEKKLGQQQELNKIGIEKGDQDPAYTQQKAAIAKTDKVMAMVEKVMNTNNAVYNQGRSDIIGNLNAPEARKAMLRSGMPELAGLSEQVQGQNRLAQGVNVLADPSKMTTAERVQNKMTESASGANEFAASMMKNLQWSLMFAFSGTVFQALSQIPTQATYETIQPVYSGISNIMGLTPLKNEFMQFGAKAPDIMGDLQTRSNSLQALLGSKSEADKAVTSALDISKSQPIQFGEAMEVMSAIATFPTTKAQASNPAFQKTMFENVQLLSMLAPEQGTSGSLFAIREMLSGQYRSMQMRFNMSPEMLASYSGTTATQMKSMGGVEMMGAMNKSLMGMFGGSEILMRRGAETQVQMRNIGDTMTSSILNPMVSQTDPGISLLINKLSTTVSDGAGGRTAAPAGSLGSLGNMLPEAQQKAIKDAALATTALRSNVKYELGDTAETVAEKMTAKRGGSYEENLQQVKSSYSSAISANVQSLYSTPAGAQSVIAAGVNTSLSNILQSFSAVSGIAGITEGFLGKQSDRTDKYTQALEINAGPGNEGGRKKAAQDFIQGFMTDIRDSMKEASASLNAGEFKTVLKQITDTVRVGAETVFAPIGEAIMVQTAKTAMNIPGVMVGGALAGAVREVGSGISSIAGGVVDVVTTPFKSNEQKAKDAATSTGGAGTFESVMSGSASVANMAAWTMGISGLKSSPLGAATKFMGASLISKGFNDVAIGDGGAGAANMSMGLAGVLLPSIIPAVMESWTSRSITQAIRRSGDVSGGASPSPVARGGIIGTMGNAMGWLGAATGIADVTSSLVYNRNAASYNSNLTGAAPGSTAAPLIPRDMRSGWRQFTTAMVGETAGMGGFTTQGMLSSRGISTSLQGGQGLLGSGVMRGVMAAGGALSAYTGSQALSEEDSGKGTAQKTGEWLQTIGGVTMSLAAFGGGLAPAIAAVGGLATAAGMVTSYLGKANTVQDEKETKRVAQQKQLVEDAAINNPLKSARDLGATQFDQLKANFNLGAFIPANRLDEMRSTNQQLQSYIPEKTSDIAQSSVKEYENEMANDAEAKKRYKEKQGAKSEESGTVLTAIAKYSSDFMDKAFKEERAVYQTKDGKVTSEVKPEVRQELVKSIKNNIPNASDDFAERQAAKIIAETAKAKEPYTALQDTSRKNMAELAPKITSNAINEMWVGSYVPLPMPTSAYDNPSNVQQIPERTVENIQRANSTFNQMFGGISGVQQSYQDDIVIGGLSESESKTIKDAKLGLQYELLVNNLADPASLKGADAMQTKAELSQIYSPAEVEKLYHDNIIRTEGDKIATGQKHVEMLKSGRTPGPDEDIQGAKDEAFTRLAKASESAAGNVEAFSTALGNFLKTVQEVTKTDDKSLDATKVGASNSAKDESSKAAEAAANKKAEAAAAAAAAKAAEDKANGGEPAKIVNPDRAKRFKAYADKVEKETGVRPQDTGNVLTPEQEAASKATKPQVTPSGTPKVESPPAVPQASTPKEQPPRKLTPEQEAASKATEPPIAPPATPPKPATPEQNPIISAAGDVLGAIFSTREAAAADLPAEEQERQAKKKTAASLGAPVDKGDNTKIPKARPSNVRTGDNSAPSEAERSEAEFNKNMLLGKVTRGNQVSARDGDTDSDQKTQTKIDGPLDVTAPSQQELMKKFLRKDPRSTTVRDVGAMAAGALGGNMIVYGGDDSSRTVDANGVSSTPKPSEDKGMALSEDKGKAYGASSSVASQRRKGELPGGDMYWRNEETGARGFASIGPNRGDQMYSWHTAPSESHRGAAGGSDERKYMTPSGLSIKLPSGTTPNISRDQRPRVAAPERMSMGSLMQEANANQGTVYTQGAYEISVPKQGDNGFGGTYVNQVPSRRTASGAAQGEKETDRHISLVPTAKKNEDNQQRPTIIINGPIHTPIANIHAR